MFLLIGLILFIVSFFEIFLNKKNNIFFLLLSIVLIFFLCFRFGQGTDYFGYYWLYEQVGSFTTELFNLNVHGEIIWRLVESVFKQFGLSFEMFVFFISFITIVATIKLINNKSPYKVFSLFLLYPTFYLTYYFSGFRQGLVIAIFIGVGLELLIKRKYLYYSLLFLVMSFIHTSAFLLLLLPFIINIKKIGLAKCFSLVFIGFIFITISGLGTHLYSSIISGISVMDFRISFFGLLNRFIMFFIILFLYKKSLSNFNDDEKILEYVNLLWNIYRFGFIIVCFLFFTSTFSQRMTAPLKAVEIILLPILIDKTRLNARKIRKDVFSLVVVCLSILCVETYKNVNSFLVQGGYYSWVTPYNLPFVTIFNKDDIYEYRNTNLMDLID